MEFDTLLSRKCDSETAFLRLYRWDPFCISLGMYQKEDALNRQKLLEDGLDVVYRPTGGRAVLHAEELTYSVILPTSFSFTPHAIYKEVNLALKSGLTLYDRRLGDSDLEQVQPDFRSLYKQPNAVACFAATAKNELKLDHKKLIGSAQRKIGDIVLQHGSILCGPYHQRIIDYLNLEQADVDAVGRELLEKTTDIETVIGTTVDYDRLNKCIVKGFERHFASDFEMVMQESVL